MFKPVSSQIDFPKLEEKILKYWKKNKIFEKSLEKDAPKGKWTFLDGPPFITGLPHYGNLLSSLPKDLFPRYKTMQGYSVRRVWGWDCHGLPAENKVETKLGLKSKRDIEQKIGVKKFINECKLYVNDVSGEWEWYINHIGRWVDFKNAYRTMDLPYMESVMWVFRQMYDKGFIYRGLRVSLFCPHCSTPISNFEVAMDSENYKEITEEADIYKYQLTDEKDTYLLAWSTTPWTKLGTPALAVNPKLTYVKVKQGDKNYILAKSTLKMLSKEPHRVLDEYKGEKIIGKKFIPHYNFYKIDKNKNAFVVIGGDFVTADEGTGIVTIATYGEEDLIVMQKNNIQLVMYVDDEGNLTNDVPKWGGMYYLKANKFINEDLKNRGLLYRQDNYTHTVPMCWRCHTRLLYAPQDAWYVNVQKIKEKMAKTNEYVNWYPKHFKHGRFLKSLESAPDWNISRSRYWGSPIPVWECGCGQIYVPGSIKELEDWSGTTIKDLHKPEIDEITIKCRKCGKTAKRVLEVLDSWIEAGSASFGEKHYPFSHNEKLEEFYPPDFIGEYTGQIRAWFYVLHVIANALDLRNDGLNILAKNVLVEGVILGTDGRKMSKNYGNYPDPKEMLNKYGGDALRLYLLGSPVMHGEDILISEEHYRNQVKGFLLILWNVYNFFVSNAISDNWLPQNKINSTSVLDNWILSRLNRNIKDITEKGYEAYDTPEIVGHAWIFIQDLSLWYIRRIRDRIGPSVENTKDKESAYYTLWTVLKEYSKVLAPLIPFTSEEIYRNLVINEKSVHLAEWPKFDKSLYRPNLEKEMDRGIKLASKINAFRKENTIKVRIPLEKLYYKGPKRLTSDVEKVVLDEINVYKLVYKGKSSEYSVSGDATKKNQDLTAGKAREIVRQIQEERKKLGTELNENIDVTLPDWPLPFENLIKKKALIRNLKKGPKFIIDRV